MLSWGWAACVARVVDVVALVIVIWSLTDADPVVCLDMVAVAGSLDTLFAGYRSEVEAAITAPSLGIPSGITLIPFCLAFALSPCSWPESAEVATLDGTFESNEASLDIGMGTMDVVEGAISVVEKMLVSVVFANRRSQCFLEGKEIRAESS